MAESMTTVRRIACCAYFKESCFKCNAKTAAAAGGVGSRRSRWRGPPATFSYRQLIELTFNLKLHGIFKRWAAGGVSVELVH